MENWSIAAKIDVTNREWEGVKIWQFLLKSMDRPIILETLKSTIQLFSNLKSHKILFSSFMAQLNLNLLRKCEKIYVKSNKRISN